MKLNVTSTIGSNSSLEVSDKVFGAKFNPILIAQAIRVYLSNQRQGTSKVKTRSEINRTKKKWFKQKGTGNARHGARTPNIFVGGGIAHGPTGTQNWDLKLTASMRKSALASVLSKQVKNITVSDDLHNLDGKTSSAQKLLAKMLPDAEKILVVLNDEHELVTRSLRNLSHVVLTSPQRVTTYEVAYADAIVMTKDAVKSLETRLEKSNKPKVKEASAKKATPVEKTEVKPVTKKVEKAPAKKAPAKPAAKKPAVKKTTKAK